MEIEICKSLTTMQKRKFSLHCSICYEFFSKRKPARLFKNCGHTCCEQCIASIIFNSANEKTRCPFCKTVYEYETKAYNNDEISNIIKLNYPVNYFVHDLIDFAGFDCADICLYLENAIHFLKINLSFIQNHSLYLCFYSMEFNSYFCVQKEKINTIYNNNTSLTFIMSKTCDDLFKNYFCSNLSQSISKIENTNCIIFQPVKDFFNYHYSLLYMLLQTINEKIKIDNQNSHHISYDQRLLLKKEHIYLMFKKYCELIKNENNCLVKKLIYVQQLSIESIANLEIIKEKIFK